MKLGFIGTGKIALSVITGICNSKISYRKILVSKRNRKIAEKLRKRFNYSSLPMSSEGNEYNINFWIYISCS